MAFCQVDTIVPWLSLQSFSALPVSPTLSYELLGKLLGPCTNCRTLVLDKMTSKGPYQSQPGCDSLIL